MLLLLQGDKLIEEKSLNGPPMKKYIIFTTSQVCKHQSAMAMEQANPIWTKGTAMQAQLVADFRWLLVYQEDMDPEVDRFLRSSSHKLTTEI